MSTSAMPVGRARRNGRLLTVATRTMLFRVLRAWPALATCRRIDISKRAARAHYCQTGEVVFLCD